MPYMEKTTNKKHFVFLGTAGIIYYSWLFVILFVGLVITYEGTEKINWLAIGILAVALMAFIYTWISSFYNDKYLKLPYSKKRQINQEPELIGSWKFFKVYRLQLNSIKKYMLLRIEK
ncbi:hypothetical protein FC52_GL000267 [Lactobacillus pasteurii DSM 23907 = CRBIP 24.76]|uniref:Uncharacterized protein n=2 Tax=Lactobacillus pasteurii TaxID=872327 RepID=I7LE83_9LACO|nr:hypothetical protein FC52_GL000267 [Lactobacillus pasteurii DSM 23907 = CRBIP 24.76]CCI85568.1 Putative uncharacterized protein [Lactobacillus pasteurii DSM 23907 = CRBIP 24.76]